MCNVNVGPEYYVDRFTSFVNVDTLGFPIYSTAVVYLSSLSIPGRIVSIRDSTGGLGPEKFITVSTSQGVSFINGTNSASFNAPYGYITCTNQSPTIWNITNTYGFPTQSTPAYVDTLTADTIQTANLVITNEFSTSVITIEELTVTSNIDTRFITASNDITAEYLIGEFINGSNITGTCNVRTDALTSQSDTYFYIYNSLQVGFSVQNVYEIKGLSATTFLTQFSNSDLSNRFGLSNVSGIAFNNGDNNYKIYGTGTLISGTVTVLSDFKNASSIILIQRTTKNSSTELGYLAVEDATGGFSVTSYRANGNIATSDNSSFMWILFNPTFP